MSSKTIHPFSPKQLYALTNSNKTFNLWHGSIRSGKTYLSIPWLLDKNANLPDGDGMLLGQTPQTLERNFLSELMTILPKTSYHYVKNNYIDLFYNDKYTGKKKSRRFHIVGGTNVSAVRRILGSTIMIGYIDELVLIPKEVFDTFIGRFSYPESTMLGTTNPGNPNHYIIKDYLSDSKKREDWTSFSFVLENNLSLTKKVVERLKRQYMGTPALYNRMILGKWVLADGLIYSNFGDSMLLNYKELPNCYKYHVCIDYGVENPTVFLLLGEQSGRSGDEYYVLDEWYGTGKTTSQLLNHYKKFTKGKKIDKVIIDPSASALKQEFIQNKIRVTNANNLVLDGINTVAIELNRGSLKINENCTELIHEMQSYIWDKKAQEKGQDKPVKKDDHGPDALRYGIHTLESLKSRNRLKISVG